MYSDDDKYLDFNYKINLIETGIKIGYEILHLDNTTEFLYPKDLKNTITGYFEDSNIQVDNLKTYLEIDSESIDNSVKEFSKNSYNYRFRNDESKHGFIEFVKSMIVEKINNIYFELKRLEPKILIYKSNFFYVH